MGVIKMQTIHTAYAKKMLNHQNTNDIFELDNFLCSTKFQTISLKVFLKIQPDKLFLIKKHSHEWIIQNS